MKIQTLEKLIAFAAIFAGGFGMWGWAGAMLCAGTAVFLDRGSDERTN